MAVDSGAKLASEEASAVAGIRSVFKEIAAAEVDRANLASGLDTLGTLNEQIKALKAQAVIRRRLIDDGDAAAIEAKFKLGPLRKVEERTVQASRSCIHGDLHCSNVLVKSDGEAVLIDFGDAGPGFTAVDPIALELSLIFHPDAKKLGLRDGLMGNLEAWPDVDGLVQNDSLKPMVAACRDWAHDVGGGDQSVLASTYAYALRQLKYDTVDPAITVAFVAKLSERIRIQDQSPAPGANQPIQALGFELVHVVENFRRGRAPADGVGAPVLGRARG